MASSVRWYGHVLIKEVGDILRRALDNEVEGERKDGRARWTWKKQVADESRSVGLAGKVCRSK